MRETGFNAWVLVVLALAIAIPASASDFTVISSGSSSYQINGQTNPTLVVSRGQSYSITLSTVGHPFWINTVQGPGTSNGYSAFIEQGQTTGTVIFSVPMDAPDTLYYNCQFHSVMTGRILMDGLYANGFE